MAVLLAFVVFPPLAVPIYLLMVSHVPLDAQNAAPLAPACLTGIVAVLRRWPRKRAVVLTIATALLSVVALLIAFAITIVTCEDCIT